MIIFFGSEHNVELVFQFKIFKGRRRFRNGTVTPKETEQGTRKVPSCF